MGAEGHIANQKGCCGGGRCADRCSDSYTLTWTTQTGVVCVNLGDGISIRVSWTIDAGSGVCARIYPDCSDWYGYSPANGYSYTCDVFNDCSDCSTTPSTSNSFSGTTDMSCAFRKFGDVWQATVYYFALECGPSGALQAWGGGAGGPCPSDVTLTGGFSIA